MRHSTCCASVARAALASTLTIRLCAAIMTGFSPHLVWTDRGASCVRDAGGRLQIKWPATALQPIITVDRLLIRLLLGRRYSDCVMRYSDCVDPCPNTATYKFAASLLSHNNASRTASCPSHLAGEGHPSKLGPRPSVLGGLGARIPKISPASGGRCNLVAGNERNCEP